MNKAIACLKILYESLPNFITNYATILILTLPAFAAVAATQCDGSNKIYTYLSTTINKDTGISIVSATPNPVDSLSGVTLSLNVAYADVVDHYFVAAHQEYCRDCSPATNPAQICVGGSCPLSCTSYTLTNIAGSYEDKQRLGSYHPNGKISIMQNGIVTGSANVADLLNSSAASTACSGCIQIAPINANDMALTYKTPAVGASGTVNFSAQFTPDTSTGLNSTYTSNTVAVTSNLNPVVMPAVLSITSTLLLGN